ncbi:efflux RND transporter periplasmic adaptor subunit [Parasalinivibrio latis]|uniref:efflux RND transporter periplasmic adaptor subunit n=1 Tax=Parasalinivibrio latis TaxID=2952610 RepID=UPI0030DF4D3D
MAAWQRVNYFFSSKPWIISLILVLSLVAWLASGQDQGSQASGKDEKPQQHLARVKVTTFNAAAVTRTITLYGRTAPDRTSTVSAEVSGKILSLAVSKGSRVEKGQLIAQIDTADRAAQLRQAQALLKARQKEYSAAASLRKKGLQGEVSFSLAEANLAEAKAAVANLKLALANTDVKAPFTGILESLHIEQGDYVGIGDPIGQLVDLNPLVVKADVSERHIGQLDSGSQAQVTLVSGETRQGSLRYRSSIASETTNTFGIELTIDNPGQALPAGISAEVELPLDEKLAVKLTPAMLALDENGNLGVKTLVEENRVKFIPIKLVKAESDGVWLTGLGERVDIITVGQGFVRDGDEVEATLNSPQAGKQ